MAMLDAAETISVSLIVPVRNEEHSIEALVASIYRQAVIPSEVVLVDGGSTDRTVEIIRRVTENDDRFRLIQAGRATPGRGRNIGIAAATNDWIALTDAGIQLDRGWLSELISVAVRNPTTRVVYGSYEPVVSTLFLRCAALAYVAPYTVLPDGLMRGPSTASMLLHREVWDGIGGFPDARAAEDLIFFEGISKGGYSVDCAPAAKVYWEMQPSLVRTFHRFVTYSRHNVWAGRQNKWHYGIARMYVVAIAIVALAVFHSSVWAVLLLSGVAARVAVSIWRRRIGRKTIQQLDPLQFFGVAIVLLTIDLATFTGWAQALYRQRLEDA